MFKRIIYDEWTNIVPMISFFFTLTVFLAITARAYFMRKDKIEKLEHMPLNDDEAQQPSRS